MITAHGGTALEYRSVARRSGIPIVDIFRMALPDLAEPDATAYRDEYRDLYEREAIPATRLFPGAEETLRAFHRAGIRQATVTGKRAGDCERILRGLGIGDEIECYLGGDSVERPKPAPDLVLHAMDQLGVSAAESAVVGDTGNDIEMAKRAGVTAIQALWSPDAEPVYGADHVVRTWSELRERILGADGPQRP